MKKISLQHIESCRQGDRRLQRELFDSLYAPMFRVCQRYVSNTADAEDCLMRGFMKMFTSLSSFRFEGEESLFFWVRRIMVNESLMFLRRKQPLLYPVDDEMPEHPVQEHPANCADAEVLYAAVLQLPSGYRSIFNLYEVEGYSHAEIASMLGISESTSRTQLAKAKARLRSLLQHEILSYGNRQ